MRTLNLTHNKYKRETETERQRQGRFERRGVVSPYFSLIIIWLDSKPPAARPCNNKNNLAMWHLCDWPWRSQQTWRPPYWFHGSVGVNTVHRANMAANPTPPRCSYTHSVSPSLALIIHTLLFSVSHTRVCKYTVLLSLFRNDNTTRTHSRFSPFLSYSSVYYCNSH